MSTCSLVLFSVLILSSLDEVLVLVGAILATTLTEYKLVLHFLLLLANYK